MDYYPTLEIDDIYIPRPTNQIWGRLTSLNLNLKDIPLIKSIYTIGRGEGNDIMINDLRLSSVHCIITKDENDIVTLEDMSSNGTYVGNEKVGKRKSKILLPGEEIYLLHKSKVSKGEVLGYVFSFTNHEANELKRPRDYEQPQTAIEIKQLKGAEGSSQYENGVVECCQCYSLTSHFVIARPCMHNYCAGCYSKWMDTSINCPKCCDEVQALINRTLFKDRTVDPFMIHEEKRPRKLSSLDLDETVDFQKHHKNAEELVERNDIETDVSTNENSRNMMDLLLITGDPIKANKMAQYCSLFNKFTAD